MVKRVILSSLLVLLLSMVVVLMMGTAAFAGTPPNVPPASCAAHCATWFGGVSGDAKLGGMRVVAQMGNCGGWDAPCCSNWWDKFTE